MRRTVARRLGQRWPPLDLVETFRGFLAVYRDLLASAGHGDSDRASAFETLCRWTADAEGAPGRRVPAGFETVRSLVADLRRGGGEDWLQRLASVLAMLMHLQVCEDRPSRLLNHRRPHKAFSTYPTSPAVASLVGEASLSALLRDPIPSECRTHRQAERYAERALRFRIIDPSMESGQLLLGVAGALVERVHALHPRRSPSAGRLVRALLTKLCHDCLWGIDRNQLAARATALAFLLLGRDLGIDHLTLPRLKTADALEELGRSELPAFDGLVNNPPWGESLTPDERRRFRGRLRAIRHRADTYVAFAELGIGCLRCDGSFVMVVPSHFVAARNAGGLRNLLVESTEISRLVLLPRAAFADATVRGIVVFGRVRRASPKTRIHVTSFPLVKPLDGTGPVHTSRLVHRALELRGHQSWAPLLNSSTRTRRSGAACRLERVARVTIGVQPYGEGRGRPPQTAAVVRDRLFTSDAPAPGMVPALRGRDVGAFLVGSPRRFIKLGKWLKWVGDHEEIRTCRRIFVRELCRRDGRLTAAMARDGFVPLHGVLTLVPREIDGYVLTAILNSTRVAEFVRAHAASFSKVDFQRITVGELRKMPVPAAAFDSSQRARLALRPPRADEAALRRKLRAAAKKVSESPPSRATARAALRARIDEMVTEMFEFGEP